MSDLKKAATPFNGGTITSPIVISDSTGSGLTLTKTGGTGSETLQINAPAAALLVLNAGVPGGSQAAQVTFLINSSQGGALLMDGSDSNNVKLYAGSTPAVGKMLVLPAIGGALLPRMTTTARQALSLNSSHDGLCVYDTTLHKKTFWNGSAWEIVTSTLE